MRIGSGLLIFFALAYAAIGVFAGVMSHSWTTGVGVGFGAPLGALIGIGMGMLLTR